MRKKWHFFLCKMLLLLLLFFKYYFDHIECVFLFLIYFSGCLIWLLLISIEKVSILALLLGPVWHGIGKKNLSCFMLIWDHFVCIFMNIFGFSWKTEITLYETTLFFIMNLLKSYDYYIFVMNLLPFCMSMTLVWCVEWLVVQKLCKRIITLVIKYKYNIDVI